MGLLQDIQRRIRAKETEVIEIEEEIRLLSARKDAAKAYMLGLQDILPRVQKEEGANGIASNKPVGFRKGGAAEVAQDILNTSGSAMHLDQILEKMGKSGDKKAKLALASTLSRYARQGVGFKKTAPNTFALIDSETRKIETTTDELPEDFGR